MSLAQYVYNNAYKPFKKHVLELKTDKKPVSKIPQQQRYYGGVEEKAYSGTLTREQLANVVTSESLLMKGIWKENRDIFKDTWTIIHKDKEKQVDDNDLDIINNFKKKTKWDYKNKQAGISANIYGDGFLEIIWEEPEGTGIDSLAPNQSPVDLEIKSAEYIDHTEKKKGDETEYYIYKEPRIQKTYIHPSRLQHIVKKVIPGKKFGISNVFTIRKIAQSVLTADEQYGEMIEWVSTGVFDLLLKGANNDDLKNAETKITKRRKINVHDENAEWSVLNPTIFDPKNFNDYFLLKTSAAVDMAQYILSGVQPGQLTGSDMGFSDYLNHIQSLRYDVFIPHINQICTLLLEGQGRSFEDYEVDWQMSYIDETIEASILKMRSEAGSLAYDRGVIDEDEYRNMLKNGISDFKGESILDKALPVNPRVLKPIMEQPSVVENPVLTANYMTTAERVLFEIEKLKGKQEVMLEAQRLKEAEKLKNDFKPSLDGHKPKKNKKGV